LANILDTTENNKQFPLKSGSVLVFDTEELMHRSMSTILFTYCLVVPKYCINILWLKLWF